MDKKETLQPFEAIGYHLEPLCIVNPDDEGHIFTYYTFAGKYPPEVIDVWDIVGLRFQSHDPLLLNMRMMQIDSEMFDVLEDFIALRDAPCSLSLDPDRLQALIDFFEGLKTERSTPIKHSPPHFQQMIASELQDIHVPPWKLPYLDGTVYRYLPDNELSNNGLISVFRFPRWSSKYGSNQSTVLGYDVFSQEELAELGFEPFPPFLGKTRGVRPVTYNQAALSEFVDLLKQYL
jgi:hypothetical protein